MRRLDLSHPITDGMVTYPGIPAPKIGSHMTFDESHAHYAPGTEFSVATIHLAANTGTYLDTPAHRHRDGWDLSALALDVVAGVDGLVVRCEGTTSAITPEGVSALEVGGRAVLFHTGWARHWGTEEYFTGHPYLGAPTAEFLVAEEAALVGIDSLNIDGTDDGTRPVHTALLAAGIPIVEHLTGLDGLPDTGFSFFAVPPRIDGVATFPVRAFAMWTGGAGAPSS